jgi:putative membrane protein insertion efficiency factor
MKLEKAALWLIRQYQRWVSPMLMPACRYQPTCSDYAAEALARHGLFYGTALTLWRLMRCNPFAKGGLDLVPLETFCNKNDSEHVPHSHSALIPGRNN